jgi:HTH-type transcriptional regulator/antitoxin HigA
MVEKHKPFVNIGPGDIIKDELEALNWTQDDLSHIVGMSKKAVNEIITNKTAITIDTARLLSKAIGPSPQFWLNADANYRLKFDKEDQREKETELKALIFKYMPVREMIKKGWLPEYKNPDELVKGVKAFWNMDKIDFSFMEDIKLPNFRKSSAYPRYNTYYALCWYQMARYSAGKFRVSAYDENALKQLTVELYRFTDLEGGVEQFIEALNGVGIKFFILSHLSRTYLDGASFLDGKNPVIVYSLRYNRIDHFWFTVAHEISHILRHLKEGDFYLDDLDFMGMDVEKEADLTASRMLKVYEILEFFRGKMRYISMTQIDACRKALHIHPAIIVGVLQYYGRLSRRNLNRFKQPVADLIPEKYFVERFL